MSVSPKSRAQASARERKLAKEIGISVAALRRARAALAPKAAQTVAPARTGKAKPSFFEAVIAKRVPCAHGSASCKGKTFAPNGVGKVQHTTCKKGLAALKAARA